MARCFQTSSFRTPVVLEPVLAFQFDELGNQIGMRLDAEDVTRNLLPGNFRHEEIAPETQQSFGSVGRIAVAYRQFGRQCLSRLETPPWSVGYRLQLVDSQTVRFVVGNAHQPHTIVAAFQGVDPVCLLPVIADLHPRNVARQQRSLSHATLFVGCDLGSRCSLRTRRPLHQQDVGAE